MDVLSLLGFISKIAAEAPVLLPDALQIITDQQKVFTDFQKLINDFQAIKASVAASTTVPATPPAAA